MSGPPAGTSHVSLEPPFRAPSLPSPLGASHLRGDPAKRQPEGAMRTRSHARRATAESALDLDLRARVLGGLPLPDLRRVGAVSRGFREASGEAARGLTGREPMVCGGHNIQVVTGACWSLRLDTLQWRQRPQLLQPRFEAACVTLGDGTTLCIGGCDVETIQVACAVAWAARPPLSSGAVQGRAANLRFKPPLAGRGGQIEGSRTAYN